MWLFLAFLLVPLIEIALFIQVGGAIGLWPTLGIVVLTAIAGTWLVRSQGSQAIARLRRSFDELRDPTDQLAHGAMILFSGALLLTPGFFTDAVGFALLVPGIREALIRHIKARVKARTFVAGQAHWQEAGRGGPAGPGPGRDDVIEGDYRVEDGEGPRREGPSGWTRH
jgi:UPF0716 protein FxsA